MTGYFKEVQPLRNAAREMVRELGALRAERRGASISFSQGHALIEIDNRAELTASELARILGLNKSSTSRTLAQLKEHGWIRESRNNSDPRRKPYELTTKGKKKLDNLNQKVNKRVQAALATLSERERALVLKGVELYTKALKDSAPG